VQGRARAHYGRFIQLDRGRTIERDPLTRRASGDITI